LGNGGIGLLSGGLGDGEQHVAGDRRAGVHAVVAGLTEFDARAERPQGGLSLGAKVVGGRKL
jgi:hypothetical protein